MKIVFMGTPDFAVPVLEALTKEHEVVAVYTRAPKESGRGKKINKTPVHLLAEEKGILVKTPRTLKTEDEQMALEGLGAELAVVAAYGLILPQAVLDMFPKAVLTFMRRYYPDGAGAAPIQRAIEAGDEESGISIMQMAAALDAGDVLSQEAITIAPKMTGGELHDKLAAIGADLLVRTLRRGDEIVSVKQDESRVTYAEKINKDECLLDFNTPAEKLAAKIRAFSPYPAVYFIYNGERFKLLQAAAVTGSGTPGEILEADKGLVIATTDGALRAEIIQRAGKQPMPTEVLLRGFQFERGSIL